VHQSTAKTHRYDSHAGKPPRHPASSALSHAHSVFQKAAAHVKSLSGEDRKRPSKFGDVLNKDKYDYEHD
jgi:hypothetical protein